MTCCTDHRSHPVRFFAVVVLSAVAFVGQALGTSAFADKEPATALAAAAAAGRATQR